MSKVERQRGPANQQPVPEEEEKRRRLRDKCLYLNHRMVLTEGQRRAAKVRASKVRTATRRERGKA